MAFPTNIHYFLLNVLRLGEHFDIVDYGHVSSRDQRLGVRVWVNSERAPPCVIPLNFRVEHQIKAPEKRN